MRPLVPVTDHHCTVTAATGRAQAGGGHAGPHREGAEGLPRHLRQPHRVAKLGGEKEMVPCKPNEVTLDLESRN